MWSLASCPSVDRQCPPLSCRYRLSIRQPFLLLFLWLRSTFLPICLYPSSPPSGLIFFIRCPVRFGCPLDDGGPVGSSFWADVLRGRVEVASACSLCRAGDSRRVRRILSAKPHCPAVSPVGLYG